MLNMQDNHNKHVLRRLTADMTLKLGILWRPITGFPPEITAAIMNGSFHESARALNHWTHAIYSGYRSISDRYAQEAKYRELLRVEGISADRMQFWDEIADPNPEK